MSQGVDNAGSGEQTQANQEEGPSQGSLTDAQIFAQEAAKLTEGGDLGSGNQETKIDRIDNSFDQAPAERSEEAPAAEAPASPEQEQEPTKPEVDSADGVEGDDKKERNSWKEWKTKYEKEAQDRIDLENRLAALEQQANTNKEEPEAAKEPEAEPETPFEATQEVKDLLDYTPGLKEYMQHEITEAAKSMTREIIDNKLSERDAQATQAQEQEVVKKNESTFWDSVGDWFGSEYPELSLLDVRNSPEFNDWLSSKKNWVDSQLKSASSADDISGAKTVYSQYVNTMMPQASKATEPEVDTAKDDKLAAARTPSMASSPPTNSDELGSEWDKSVAAIKKKQNSQVRTTI